VPTASRTGTRPAAIGRFRASPGAPGPRPRPSIVDPGTPPRRPGRTRRRPRTDLSSSTAELNQVGTASGAARPRYTPPGRVPVRGHRCDALGRSPRRGRTKSWYRFLQTVGVRQPSRRPAAAAPLAVTAVTEARSGTAGCGTPSTREGNRRHQRGVSRRAEQPAEHRGGGVVELAWKDGKRGRRDSTLTDGSSSGPGRTTRSRDRGRGGDPRRRRAVPAAGGIHRGTSRPSASHPAACSPNNDSTRACRPGRPAQPPLHRASTAISAVRTIAVGRGRSCGRGSQR